MSVKIAHLADIQVRYGKRHDEFQTVFQRTLEDLRQQRPDRIVLAGDIFHDKVKLSPSSIELVSRFMFELSDIAPTDVILGNHDLNLKQLEQGDALSPIFDIARRLGREDKAVVATEENKGSIDFSQKAIYYYPNSGFFDISPELVYGIFSCKDNKLIKIQDKDPSRSYVAIWHGTLYGSKMDNGYDATGDDLVNIATFDGFDAVLMGDIHEYQTFERDHFLEVDASSLKEYVRNGWGEVSDAQTGTTRFIHKKIPSIGYCGSLLQQSYAESIQKGYLLWTIDKQNVDHTRRIIPNDHGWCKMTISRGENVEERIENLQFSHNKRKTKVHIVYEDYEESYSIERLNQIKQLIKDKYGCESVHVEFREMEKQTLSPEEQDQEEMDPDNIEKMFNLFLDENEFDIDDDSERKEVIDFALRMEKEMDLKPAHKETRRYTLLTTEVSNLFSFGIEPTVIHWDKLRGLTGIFGENYCGKSNLLKVVVFGSFQHIIGGAHSRYLINIYTNSDKGYVRNTYDIDGVLFRIMREVHKGKTSNSYPTKFEVFREAKDADGAVEYRWCNTMSDNSTADNTEIKRMITDALGTYDDFTKVSMHAQNEKDGYLNLEQQEKNDLIARYLNLHTYRDRHEYVKKPYNELRAKQKALGEAVDIELELKNLQLQIEDKENNNTTLEEERRMWVQKQDNAQDMILELTRKLQKVDDLGYDKKEDLLRDVATKERAVTTLKEATELAEKWLETNVTKELGIDPKRTTEILEGELSEIRVVFTSEKDRYVKLKSWLAENPKKDVPQLDVPMVSKHVDELNRNIHDYQNKRSIFLGKDCPTCRQPIEKPDPKGVEQMDALITEGKAAVSKHRASIDNFNSIVEWNRTVDNKKTTMDALEISLRSRNKTMEALKLELENFAKNKELIEVNKIIERKRHELKGYRSLLESDQKDLLKLQDKSLKYDAVVQAQATNKAIEKDIDLLQDMVKTYKVSIHGQQTRITAITSDINLLKSHKNDKVKQLNDAKSGDKMYKLYSIYLQAVERSGIPAMVIKKKLPMLNNKVNSILQTVVGFKLEFSIDMKGNITELFYNTENKWDALPLGSGSGAQQFIASIAIKDALNYVSKRSIVQPSIMMIDEGFGTLGDELRENIMTMLEYLKGKYQNVLIITHLQEIKEGADHIIEAIRDRGIIMSEAHEKDEKAGITRMHVRR